MVEDPGSKDRNFPSGPAPPPPVFTLNSPVDGPLSRVKTSTRDPSVPAEYDNDTGQDCDRTAQLTAWLLAVTEPCPMTGNNPGNRSASRRTCFRITRRHCPFMSSFQQRAGLHRLTWTQNHGGILVAHHPPRPVPTDALSCTSHAISGCRLTRHGHAKAGGSNARKLLGSWPGESLWADSRAGSSNRGRAVLSPRPRFECHGSILTGSGSPFPCLRAWQGSVWRRR